MTWKLHGTIAQEGDLVQLVGLRHKSFIVRIYCGGELQTHRGVIKFDDIIGKPWGTKISSHLGKPFYVLQPSLGDLLKELPRTSQIMYPKDIGFLLINMGIGEGCLVVEAGTGSGALTAALAFAVGSNGCVISYDNREEMQRMAKKNLARLELDQRVSFKLRDIVAGFDETGVDALFLDLPNPFDYIAQVRRALKYGGYFGSILPTANQVERLLFALRQNDFAFVDVCEVILRYYKAESERFRPVDRMVAHTGYLIFARPILIDRQGEESSELEEEILHTFDERNEGDHGV